MKREKDIIYQILRWTEDNATGLPRCIDLGMDPDKLHYHIGLCREAGFLRTQPLVGNTIERHRIIALTWAGHNALDKLKDGCDMKAICN